MYKVKSFISLGLGCNLHTNKSTFKKGDFRKTRFLGLIFRISQKKCIGNNC